MSVDMYLYKYTDVKNYSWKLPEWLVKVARGDEPVPEIVVNPKRIRYLVEEVAHWYSANAIHNWLSGHIADGERFDTECIVSREELQQFLDDVTAALASPQSADGTLIDLKLAKEHMPTDDGLFGSAEYDDGYWSDLQYTKEMLEGVMLEIEADKEENALYYYLVG